MVVATIRFPAWRSDAGYASETPHQPARARMVWPLGSPTGASARAPRIADRSVVPYSPTPAAGLLHTEIPAELLLRVRQLARARGMTLYMLLLAALGVVIARHSGQDDVVIGSPAWPHRRTPSKPDRLLRELSGDAASNSPPDPASALPKRGSADRLRRLRPSARAIRRDCRTVGPVRQLEISPPLLQIMFALQRFPATPLRLEGLQVQP